MQNLANKTSFGLDLQNLENLEIRDAPTSREILRGCVRENGDLRKYAKSWGSQGNTYIMLFLRTQIP